MEKMHIDVLSRFGAETFVPKVPTLAMRIRNYHVKPYSPLPNSPLYVQQRNYLFDDIKPSEVQLEDLRDKTQVLFNYKLARIILCDFLNIAGEIQGLMVHCNQGIGRSAAIASGLNEVFLLGDDPRRWETEKINAFVYSTLVSAAKRFRFGRFAR